MDRRTFWCIVGLISIGILWAVLENLGGILTEHYGFEQIVGMRYAVHVAILLLVCSRASLWRLVRTSRPVAQIGRGFCMFVMPMSFIESVSHMTSEAMWATFWVAPIFVLLIAGTWLRERVRPMLLIAVVGGYGAVLSILGRPPVQGWDALWPCAAALSFALYVVLSRRLREEPISTSLFYTGATVLVCMLPFMLPEWRPLDLADTLPVLGVGTVGLVLLYVLDSVLEHARASFVAPFIYGATVWEGVIQALHGHSPDKMTVAGGVALVLLLIGASWMGIRHERQ